MTLQLKVTKPLLAAAIVVVGSVSTFIGVLLSIYAPAPIATAAGVLTAALGGAAITYLTTEEGTAPPA
jgi:hypothetical protein